MHHRDLDPNDEAVSPHRQELDLRVERQHLEYTDTLERVTAMAKNMSCLAEDVIGVLGGQYPS